MSETSGSGPVDRDVGRDAQTVLELLACLRAHHPDARVLGNVRAEDAATALDRLRAEVEALRAARKEIMAYVHGNGAVPIPAWANDW